MSYTLKYTGAEIDDILDRAVEGGTIDEALALKAPLESPALTGTPTAPTPAASDNSTKVATTAYADRAAAGAAAAAYPVDSASGAIASFADGADAIPMKSFVASIDPVQNLNGQSAPYPAGGGKNKWANGDLEQSSGVGIAYSLPAGTYTISAVRSISNLNLGLRFNYADTTSTAFTLNDNTKFAGYTFTLSQDCVSFNYSIANYVSGAKITNIQIESGSTATAYAPYSNVCPISGHSGVNAVRAGVSLLPTQEERTDHDVTFTRNADGSVSLSGTATANTFYQDASSAKTHIKAGTYYITGGVSASIGVYMAGYYADGTAVSTSRSEGSERTVTLTQDAYVYLQIRVVNGTDTTGVTVYPMVSPQSGQTWKPYNGTPYPVDWTTEVGGDGYVYKGSIDLVSGVLTVTHKLLTMVSTGDWKYSTATGTFYKTISNQGLLMKDYTAAFGGLADSFAPVPANANWTSGNYVGYHSEQAAGVRFSYPALNGDLDAFKTFINGKTVVFPLATPLVYNLTPTEVLSLLGQNNCFNDCGDTAVEYRADTKTYVDSKISAIMAIISE